MRHFTGSIIIVFIIGLLCSCSKDESVRDFEPVKRTVLVYMIASNNLGSYGYDREDLTEMEFAISKHGTNGCRFLVYRVANSEPVTLFEFIQNGNRVSRKVLKTYNRTIPSTSIKRMSDVFADMVSLAPANEYGLILWSHASGWAVNLPKNRTALKSCNNGLIVRNFGMDGNAEMKLDELELALPSDLFDFVYADVCYMGAVEVAYQLRNKIDYLLASPTVTMGEGMPYHINVPEFCADVIDYKKICENTFRYYNAKSGQGQSCTISLTDCRKLESLAAVCREVYSLTPEIDDISGIQKYVTPSDEVCIFYDFGQYIKERLKQLENNTALLNEFDRALNDAVLYKQSTSDIYKELLISKNNYSGLSVYIEGTGGKNNDDYYHTIDWYKATRKF